MRTYVFGAGASVSAGYPLASQLLNRLAERCRDKASSVDPRGEIQNRILQIRETFGTLEDFEQILGKLESLGTQRVPGSGRTSYRQAIVDLVQDGIGEFLEGRDETVPSDGFYPQYLRSDLVGAFRDYFYEVESTRTTPTGYEYFARSCANSQVGLVTFNYDIALERALAGAGRWDIGTGYGFTFRDDRPRSPLVVHKLHGSTNWFKRAFSNDPCPIIFGPDLALLGFENVRTSLGLGERTAVDEPATFILPDPNKKFYWDQFWRPLWHLAAQELERSSEVFVIGYSLPFSDKQARDLLFEHINRSASIAVYSLGASERIAEEFRAGGFARVRAYPSISFEELVKQDSGSR